MITLSPQIVLYPSDSPAPAVESGWLALPHLRESTAFGDGSHPTTRLCAGAVDVLCRLQKPHSVLDVGTGTGILARIARQRGAKLIFGTDIDPNAVLCAQAQAALDSHRVKIQFSENSPDHFGARFNLVIANILEGPLRELAPALSRSLAQDGLLLLSGFTRIQTPALRTLFINQGLSFVSEAHLDEWALLTFRRS
jgi:ribosomal protein L11 methyltransferase